MIFVATTECVQPPKHKIELCLDTDKSKSLPDLRLNVMGFDKIKPFTTNDNYIFIENLSIEEMDIAIMELSSKNFESEWELEDNEYWNNYLDS
ncbi:hypothetical protein [Myroides odoratimimus]|uniref:hypothetical protein n=1 Tax=Myroides odoratimimus TaxID=76832 RepID=UPI0004697077|nr:hypothetical protein [Myroides odoratimimus]